MYTDFHSTHKLIPSKRNVGFLQYTQEVRARELISKTLVGLRQSATKLLR